MSEKTPQACKAWQVKGKHCEEMEFFPIFYWLSYWLTVNIFRDVFNTLVSQNMDSRCSHTQQKLSPFLARRHNLFLFFPIKFLALFIQVRTQLKKKLFLQPIPIVRQFHLSHFFSFNDRTPNPQL